MNSTLSQPKVASASSVQVNGRGERHQRVCYLAVIMDDPTVDIGKTQEYVVAACGLRESPPRRRPGPFPRLETADPA